MTTETPTGQHACPRCRGFVTLNGDGPYCANCGWRPWSGRQGPVPSANGHAGIDFSRNAPIATRDGARFRRTA